MAAPAVPPLPGSAPAAPAPEAAPVTVTPVAPAATEKSVDVVSPAASEAPKAAAPKKAEKKEEKPAVAKTEKTEKPAAEKKAAKPKKPAPKVVFPKETPKSLRQDYLSPSAGSAPAAVPMEPAAPANAEPSDTPPGTYKINKLKKHNEKIKEAKTFPKSLPAVKTAKADLNELDVLKALPDKEEKVVVKTPIVMEDGNFSNPFSDDMSDDIQKNGSQALASLNNDPNTPQTPVVDMTQSAADGSATVADNNVGPNGVAVPVKKDKGPFYMRDKSLQVEVKDAPKNSLNNMSNAYEALKVGQYESAIKYYNEVLESEPKNEKALFGIATAYHMSKDYDKAKEAYLKIIKNDPEYWPAINNYIILVTEENPERAIPNLEDLQKRNPDFAAIPAQIGNLYYERGDSDKAIEYYVKAIKLDPKNIEYRYNLAIILDKANRYADATAMYRGLLEDASKGAELPTNPMTIKDRYDELMARNDG